MKPSNATTRPIRSTVPRERAGIRGCPLHAFIAYSDLPAARRATLTILDTLRTASRKFELQPMLWRFDQLTSAHWKDRAVEAALQADVIVLTSSEPGLLTGPIEQWVHAYLARNRGRAVTIVAIAGEADAWTISIEEPHAECAAPDGQVVIEEPALVGARE